MPFYEYVPLGDEACPECQGAFTVLQKLSDPRLTACPECGRAVRRIISAPHVVAGQAHRLKESNIEKAGFTQYKKIGQGVYEKTAGKGPGMISSGDD